MNISIIETFSEIKSEKMVDKTVIMQIVEDVFRTELRRKFGSDENFDIILNPTNGDFEIWKVRTVVEDNQVEDKNLQISLSDVSEIEDDFEIGEEFSEEFKMEEFGRRSILNIKQNLKSKFRDYDALQAVKRFEDMIGYLYTAEVKHIKRNIVILMDSDGNEVILPRENQIKREFYKKGQYLSGVIESAEVISGKPIVKISRSSEKFIEALLEEEIIEIFDGVISIKAIAREPGVKSKVLVESYDDRIDPVGICVGNKGSRISSIIRKLNGETIDIINYTDNTSLLLSRCLKPAKINSIQIEEDTINVMIDFEEIGKAVGKQGVNIKLTSKLVGYKVNLVNTSFAEDDYDINLREFNDEIEDWVIDEFIKIGLDTAKSVLNYSVSTLEDKTDLEIETIEEVVKILKSEFDEQS
jgi:transcription termination/antitermination protein NusA